MRPPAASFLRRHAALLLEDAVGRARFLQSSHGQRADSVMSRKSQALAVLTGSLIRVPLGIWPDKYGGRIVMALLMALTAPAIWLMSYATAYWHFLVIGLFVGLAGGSFSVGTPYVARWFPKNRQGFAMGVYGAGNSGAAVNK